jgi:hypothetical protein
MLSGIGYINITYFFGGSEVFSPFLLWKTKRREKRKTKQSKSSGKKERKRREKDVRMRVRGIVLMSSFQLRSF